jgi:putative redox protein
MSTKSLKFDFLNKSGETLTGRLELPLGKPLAFAIMAHCFTCSKDLLAASRIAKKLTDSHIAILRFDFTGLGNSEGDFSNTNFSSNVEDLYSAYDAIKNKYEAPSVLIGHSLGGAAVLMAAKELSEVTAVVTIAAPSDTLHVADNFGSQVSEIQKNGEAEVNLAGRKFHIKKQFLDDIANQSVLDGLSSLKKSFLILHSPSDKTVSIDHAAKIYQSVKHPKSFITLDNSDHLLMKKEDAEYAAQLIGTWVSRYIKNKEELIENNLPTDGDILVVSRSKHKFTQDIYSKTNSIVADEPLSYDGDDLGMNPYELLQASLGACTAMTMRMYAEHKKFDLQDIKVELKHSKSYSEDVVNADVEKVKFDQITKKITITGDLTDEQRTKIIAIAEKCPVNRTLKSNIVIKNLSD